MGFVSSSLDDEFAIPGLLCDQDDLQLITYWWGEDYLDQCIAHEDGAFLETHDFPQTITPLSEDCGGHILLARPSSRDDETKLEVVAVTIPYVYTMVLGKNSWHGDMGLKGMHLMAMTANHLIMEGTTKSWFLKDATTTGVDLNKPESFGNFKYKAQYGKGSREYCQDFLTCDGVKIPEYLHSLVSMAEIPPVARGPKVQCEHWNMFTDEVIRKYAPWSTPSSERVAVAPQDAKLFRRSSSRPQSLEAVPEVSALDTDKVYEEHQHDLAYRFDQGSVQLYDTHRRTVGPMNPFWMLKAPRQGKSRYLIDKVVGRTIAGTECFTMEDMWSDSTVATLLDESSMNGAKDTRFSIVSQGSNSEILEWSDVVLANYPEPEVRQDGTSELSVTVVAQKMEEEVPWDELFEHRERPVIKLFWGLISFRK